MLLLSAAQALSLDDAKLLQKEYQLYQAWALSRNYFFGATVKADRIKALTWQIIYVDMLPQLYPGKEQLLAPFKEGLSAQQIRQARQLAQNLVYNNELPQAFSEIELHRVYTLHEENISWSTFKPLEPPRELLTDFSKWLDWLAANSYDQTAVELEQARNDLIRNKRYPIVFGQIIIKGPEPVAMVRSSLRIFPGGFFIGQATEKALSFYLPGYEPVTLPLDKNKTIQGLPPVIFKLAAVNKKTGVVGRVLPWAGIEKSNILLSLAASETGEIKNPWYQPIFPLTMTNSGQFFTTDLRPGRYELFINTAGISTSKEFRVRSGEIRGLSLIDLRKLVK
jgi:hypothetical protein